MSDQNIGNMDNTDESLNNNQAPVEKTYTQKEFDDHMAKLKASVSRKYEKTFGDLGDLDELRQLKVEAEQRKLEDQKKRGEFDKIMSDLATSHSQNLNPCQARATRYGSGNRSGGAPEDCSSG